MNHGELTFLVNRDTRDELVVRGYYGQDGETTGFFFEEGGFSGWDDGGGDMTGTQLNHPEAHGLFDTPTYQGGRAVTASFFAIAPSWQELQRLRDVMMRPGADGERMHLQTKNRDVSRFAFGKRQGLPTFTDAGVRRNGVIRASCEMQFVCADPRLYGEQRRITPGSTVKITNRGNFPAMPRLTLSGNKPGGYTVNGPGGSVRVLRPLVSGKPHTLDLYSEELYIGGAVVNNAFGVMVPFRVPASDEITVTVDAGVTISGYETDTYT